MSDPCRQEDAIDDIKDTLKRVAMALETLAVQGEAIKHLQEDMRDQKNSTNNLYSRVRAVELQPVKELSKVKVAAGSAIISAICSSAGSFIQASLIH